MPRDERHTETIPYGTLGIIPLASCTEMGKKVDEYLVTVSYTHLTLPTT